MTSDGLMDYRADNPDPIPLLYQAGYLTIDSYDIDTDRYTLRFPDKEVTSGFFDLLGKNMFGARNAQARRNLDAMARAIRQGDEDDVVDMICRMRAEKAARQDTRRPENDGNRY